MKVMIIRLLDFTSAPKCLWLLAALYVAFCLNHTVDSDVGNGSTTPYTYSTGRSDDISPLLCFRFYEPVYCLQPPKKHQFPSVSKEICGRWVGISENVGHAMTWLVLTDITQKIHSVSEICSALDPKLRNLSLDPLSTTDFKMLDNNPSVPLTSSADPNDAVFFAHDGENAPSTMVDRFKSVMIDKNGDQRTDEMEIYCMK